MTKEIFFGTNSVIQNIGLSEKKVVETFLNIFFNLLCLLLGITFIKCQLSKVAPH
jgi:hypothetical protein